MRPRGGWASRAPYARDLGVIALMFCILCWRECALASGPVCAQLVAPARPMALVKAQLIGLRERLQTARISELHGSYLLAHKDGEEGLTLTSSGDARVGGRWRWWGGIPITPESAGREAWLVGFWSPAQWPETRAPLSCLMITRRPEGLTWRSAKSPRIHERPMRPVKRPWAPAYPAGLLGHWHAPRALGQLQLELRRGGVAVIKQYDGKSWILRRGWWWGDYRGLSLLPLGAAVPTQLRWRSTRGESRLDHSTGWVLERRSSALPKHEDIN